jgi:hypothetical protein
MASIVDAHNIYQDCERRLAPAWLEKQFGTGTRCVQKQNYATKAKRLYPPKRFAGQQGLSTTFFELREVVRLHVIAMVSVRKLRYLKFSFPHIVELNGTTSIHQGAIPPS